MSDSPTIQPAVEVSAAALELLALLARDSTALPDESRRQLHALFDSAIALRRRAVVSSDEFDQIHDIVAAKLDGAPIPFPRVGETSHPQPSPPRAIQPLSPSPHDGEILDVVPVEGDAHGADVLEAIYLDDLPHEDRRANDEVLDAVDIRANLDDPDVIDALAVESFEGYPKPNGADKERKGEEELSEGLVPTVGENAPAGTNDPIPGLADVPDPSEEEGGLLRGLAEYLDE